jgi:hypothetical protein
MSCVALVIRLLGLEDAGKRNVRGKFFDTAQYVSGLSIQGLPSGPDLAKFRAGRAPHSCPRGPTGPSFGAEVPVRP